MLVGNEHVAKDTYCPWVQCLGLHTKDTYCPWDVAEFALATACRQNPVLDGK